MKHTSRKKMLLSSVAMLLVAMLALGSATFAWFTSNPKAEAKGLSLKTTASTGLVVRTDSDSAWSHSAALCKGQAANAAFNLTPVSQDQTAGKADEFWTVSAQYATAPDASDTEAMTKVTSIGGAVAEVDDQGQETINYTTGDLYAENVYFRLSDGSNVADAADKKVVLNGVSIKKNATNGVDMDGTIRVAVVDKNKNILGTFARSTKSANGTLTGTTKTTGDFSPAIVDVPATTQKVTLEGNKVINCAAKGTLTASSTNMNNYVTVYVYLDGQDANCYSDKVGTVNAVKIIDSIQLDFELVKDTTT